MSKIVYDVIQRFEVENGIPRLVSTNIQVIQGGEDLMSLATNLLEQLGFAEKFKVSQASQYVGYRLKNPGKGAKRYQLVLAQRKEGLCISIPQEFLYEHILELGYWADIPEEPFVTFSRVGIIWVIPSKKDVFLESLLPQYWNILQSEEKIVGRVRFNEYTDDGYGCGSVIPDTEIIPRHEVHLEALSDTNSYLILGEDRLFPYTWQASISSSEILKEFVGYFAKILMEQQ
jgi:hypothetical protein